MTDGARLLVGLRVKTGVFAAFFAPVVAVFDGLDDDDETVLCLAVVVWLDALPLLFGGTLPLEDEATLFWERVEEATESRENETYIDRES